VPPPKEPRYRSKYPNTLAPTGSTFINHTTSRPGIANLSGDFRLHDGAHRHTDMYSTFGKPRGASKPQTTEFQKKQSGTMGSNKLPDSISSF